MLRNERRENTTIVDIRQTHSTARQTYIPQTITTHFATRFFFNILATNVHAVAEYAGVGLPKVRFSRVAANIFIFSLAFKQHVLHERIKTPIRLGPLTRRHRKLTNLRRP